MAFPTSPSNGDIYVKDGVSYQYTLAENKWAIIIDPDKIASNIKNGVEIDGVTGTYEGSGYQNITLIDRYSRFGDPFQVTDGFAYEVNSTTVLTFIITRQNSGFPSSRRVVHRSLFNITNGTFNSSQEFQDTNDNAALYQTLLDGNSFYFNFDVPGGDEQYVQYNISTDTFSRVSGSHYSGGSSYSATSVNIGGKAYTKYYLIQTLTGVTTPDFVGLSGITIS